MRPDELPSALASLSTETRYRKRYSLKTPQGRAVAIGKEHFLSFASNDYLALAAHPAMKKALSTAAYRWGVGAGASHLIVGHFSIHDEVENSLAHFVGCEAALLFTSGYTANLAVISSLLGKSDAIFCDKLNHASLVDACRLNQAVLRRFRHNDLAHLERLLMTTPAHTRLIAVEGVYSMDGDEAPLEQLLDLAERYDAWLYVDDAHGFGLLGDDGRGCLGKLTSSSPRVVYMATLGKAAGTSGAFVAGSQTVIEWLVNTARSYIYTTAISPAIAATILTSLTLIKNEQWRRDQLALLIDSFTTRAQEQKLSLLPSRTPIQPIVIGSNIDTLNVAKYLRDQGIWVPVIRPPTVAPGSARLRLSLTADHSLADIDRLICCLARALLT